MSGPDVCGEAGRPAGVIQLEGCRINDASFVWELGGRYQPLGRSYFSLSTYNGTETGCDGKPYHFCNAILELDPETRRFEFSHAGGEGRLLPSRLHAQRQRRVLCDWLEHPGDRWQAES